MVTGHSESPVWLGLFYKILQTIKTAEISQIKIQAKFRSCGLDGYHEDRDFEINLVDICFSKFLSKSQGKSTLAEGC